MQTIKLIGGSVVLKNGLPSCECCEPCCVNLQFSNFFIPGDIGDCNAVPYGLQTVTLPQCAPKPPLNVTITGSVDDELLINGEIIEPGQYPFRDTGCNGAHSLNYTFTLSSNSFTVAAGDNHGTSVRYNLTICFSYRNPLP